MIGLSVRCFLSFRFHHNRSRSACFQTFPIDFSFLQRLVTKVLDVTERHCDNLPSTGSRHGVLRIARWTGPRVDFTDAKANVDKKVNLYFSYKFRWMYSHCQ